MDVYFHSRNRSNVWHAASKRPIDHKESVMKVALIGAGSMGSELARLIVTAGHTLYLTSRNAEKARALAASVGATYRDRDVAQDADIVIVATGYADAVGGLRSAGDLNGKVVVDITNPLTADYSGLTLGYDTSAAEEIQKAFPRARVVKAFNTIFAQVLAAGPKLAGATVPVFVAGDDAEARKAVKALVETLGFRAVDSGAVKNARFLEPLALMNIYLGYGAGRGTAIAPTWIGIP
jgi:8-hydroxy-5-deazaflavin:NADPH oxidoreductase